MTADIRTAAQREAERRYKPDIFRFHGGAEADMADSKRAKFIDGAVWGAARVTPTREQVAEAIHNALQDSMNGGCYRWTAKCIERGGSCVALADAVLQLLAGLAEGESYD